MAGKYFVESFYNYKPDASGNTVDYTKIGIADKEDEKRDGENWSGRDDGYRFNLYESIEEAIIHAGYIADKITFVGLSEEDMNTANAIVCKLMNDEAYLKQFGRQLKVTK